MKLFLFTLSAVTLMAQPAQQAKQPMSFFITSVGVGNGANLGGIAGADAHCQKLAAAAGAGGRTWRAYLSTSRSDGGPAVNARDRIGKGPWHNFRGTMIARDLEHLHGDTLELARTGNLITKNNALNEKGRTGQRGGRRVRDIGMKNLADPGICRVFLKYILLLEGGVHG
jgi:hypothetical protein